MPIQKLSQEMDEACLGVENSTQAMEQSMHQSSNYLKQLSKMVHEESIGASLLQGYLDKAMASISYLPEALKKGLNSLEQQLETIQGLDSSIQAMQHSTEYKLKDLDMNKTLIHRLRDHNLHLEKEVAEFKI